MDIYFKGYEILQLNITKKCNMSCFHCHVEARSDRDEMMDKEVMDLSLEFYKKFGFKSLDITGGAPEMNENLEYLLKIFTPFCDDISIRSNLTILLEEKYKKYINIFKKYKVKVIASLPCYTEENVDKMRGRGSFNREIEVIKILNKNEILINLVYNPLGAFLPSNQADLEVDYKKELAKFGITFNSLLSITNCPIGRFKDDLIKKNQYENYIKLLKDNFKEENLENLMCKKLVNIAYNGDIFDCDFNGALNLKSELNSLKYAKNLSNLSHKIKFDTHCYACLSGAGSSCFGSLV